LSSSARRPTREVQALARVPGVTVTGFVEDIRRSVHGATLSVCPLRLARGVQNKVLEAMAMGVPVVASPAVAEGIDAQPGRELVVARVDDEGRAMAEAIAGLLGDPARCEALARAARARVVERYGWQPRADQLYEELLREAAAQSLRR
jgi:glycosyltransferase involved in cell wall biosynthesis